MRIMTPGEYCYFDAYQDNPSGEPEAIGGYLPLKKVYSYNPVPDSLTLEESKRILGVQANLCGRIYLYAKTCRIYALSSFARTFRGSLE